MTPGRSDGLTRPQLLPEPCPMGGPLSAYPEPPDCSVDAGVVDRPAYGSADTTPAALARTPALRRAACSRRSRSSRRHAPGLYFDLRLRHDLRVPPQAGTVHLRK